MPGSKWKRLGQYRKFVKLDPGIRRDDDLVGGCYWSVASQDSFHCDAHAYFLVHKCAADLTPG